MAVASTLTVAWWRDHRRALAWWAGGVAIAVLMATGFYPAFQGQADSFEQLTTSMPPAARALFGMDEGVSLGSPAGFVWGRLFSLIAPVLFVVQGVGAGARAIAGDERDGLLEPILAGPVRRTQLVVGRGAAVLGQQAALGGVLLVVLLGTGLPTGATAGLGVASLVCATGAVVALGGAGAMLALLTGAIGRARGAAVALPSAVIGLGYLVSGLAAAVPDLQWLRRGSLWSWALQDNVLHTGPRWSAVLVPLAVALAALAFAVFAFGRRDLH